jgi:hypothetical protein
MATGGALRRAGAGAPGGLEELAAVGVNDPERPNPMRNETTAEKTTVTNVKRRFMRDLGAT